MVYDPKQLQAGGVTEASINDQIASRPDEQAVVSVMVLEALSISPKELAERHGRHWIIEEELVWEADKTLHPGVALRGPALILEPIAGDA